VGVVVADLDSFKALNDRFGHLAGDTALAQMGRLLADAARRIDTVARTGGEEFALILPDTSAHEAFAVAERLRSDVERTFADTVAKLTVSLGVVAYPEHGLGRGGCCAPRIAPCTRPSDSVATAPSSTARKPLTCSPTSIRTGSPADLHVSGRRRRQQQLGIPPSPARGFAGIGTGIRLRWEGCTT
jgi:hypothetical protein